MIDLTTGLPGSGKTLRVLVAVKELAEQTGRNVYYHGINDLILPWDILSDPEKWYECPNGSIIVIDECQKVFRPQSAGSAVPRYISELETHRHKGLDLYLITQHPMLIHTNVRRLVESHVHVCRRFGFQRATLLQFESCKDSPLQSQGSAQKSFWSYPKEAFQYYKSAEIHTVKRRVPKYFIILLLTLVFVVGCVYYFFRSQVNAIKKTSSEPEKISQQHNVRFNDRGLKSDKDNKTMNTVEYLSSRSPRVPGLPHTAPAYDEVTKPVRAPFPVGAVIFGGVCKAYTSQGTVIDMQDNLCRSIVDRGFYRDFDDLDKRDSRPVELAKVHPSDPQVPTVSTIPSNVGLDPVFDGRVDRSPSENNSQQPPTQVVVKKVSN